MWGWAPDASDWQACVTGAGLGEVAGECTCFDRYDGGIGDGGADADDYEAFEACASGPDVRAEPGRDGQAGHDRWH